jgi:hypothetical protein
LQVESEPISSLFDIDPAIPIVTLESFQILEQR